MQMGVGQGQVPEEPVSFLHSFSFLWPSFIHLGQEPPSHLHMVLKLRKGPHRDCHHYMITKVVDLGISQPYCYVQDIQLAAPSWSASATYDLIVSSSILEMSH